MSDLIMRNLTDAELQFELEKAQTILGKIEAEIQWRRKLKLEAEVRMEMMIDREMTMRRAGGALAFLQETPVALPRVFPPATSFAFSGCNAFSMAPSPRPPGMKPEPEESKEKLTVLLPDRRTGLELKRKADMEEKKGKEVKAMGEWKCNLCNICSNSEKTLNDHLQGKKHMAKMNNLSASSVVSSCSKLDANSGKAEKEEDAEEELII